MKSRGWTFTINNPTDNDLDLILDMSFKYLIFAFEKVNTEHIQGYVYFYNQRHMKAVKKLLPRAHLEKQKGSKIEAMTYCMKDGDFYEFGTTPHQGKRSDLDAIKYYLLYKKKDMKEISLQYFNQWCQYNRSFDKFVDMHTKYDTSIVFYDYKSLECLKKIHSYKNSFIYYDTLYLESDMIKAYFSGKYKYMFIPDDTLMTHFLSQVDIKNLKDI